MCSLNKLFHQDHSREKSRVEINFKLYSVPEVPRFLRAWTDLELFQGQSGPTKGHPSFQIKQNDVYGPSRGFHKEC